MKPRLLPPALYRPKTSNARLPMPAAKAIQPQSRTHLSLDHRTVPEAIQIRVLTMSTSTIVPHNNPAGMGTQRRLPSSGSYVSRAVPNSFAQYTTILPSCRTLHGTGQQPTIPQHLLRQNICIALIGNPMKATGMFKGLGPPGRALMPSLKPIATIENETVAAYRRNLGVRISPIYK